MSLEDDSDDSATTTYLRESSKPWTLGRSFATNLEGFSSALEERLEPYGNLKTPSHSHIGWIHRIESKKKTTSKTKKNEKNAVVKRQLFAVNKCELEGKERDNNENATSSSTRYPVFTFGFDGILSIELSCSKSNKFTSNRSPASCIHSISRCNPTNPDRTLHFFYICSCRFRQCSIFNSGYLVTC